jgi:uncharacterized membrane protein YeaQ/YmgE (transglycosylase-associated protein family)
VWNIIWITVIGFIADLIARVLSPGRDGIGRIRAAS